MEIKITNNDIQSSDDKPLPWGLIVVDFVGVLAFAWVALRALIEFVK